MKKYSFTNLLTAGVLAAGTAWAYAGPEAHQDAHAEAATPTQVLTHEHRVVERMVEVLDTMADRATQDERLDVEAGRQAVDFLKGFLDRCHHAKEEQLLFPALKKQGADAPLVKTLLKEHDEGRNHVKAMSKALDAANSAPAASAHTFAEHARAYAKLLRDHIKSEEGKLFPAADRSLTPEAQAQLTEGFERVEAEETGEGVHEKYLRIANELADHYGVADTADGHHAH